MVNGVVRVRVRWNSSQFPRKVLLCSNLEYNWMRGRLGGLSNPPRTSTTTSRSSGRHGDRMGKQNSSLSAYLT